MISERSIQAGLEQTRFLGRSQLLTHEEAVALGVSEASILVDGAHTEASAKGLSDVIRMTYPDGLLAFVVAMANDKDHLAFPRQFLTDSRPELVLLTEVSIAGSKSRATPASTLKDAWARTAADLGLRTLDIGIIDGERSVQSLISLQTSADNKPVMLAACRNLSVRDSIEVAHELLQSRDKPHLIVVTGSLHIVSSILADIGCR